MNASTDSTRGLREPTRIPELDGIRGLAALGIVLWHYIPSIVVREPGTIYSYANRLLSLCWAGVDLFFVLSGFLIGSILLREADSERFFSTFYARRALRIVPLYVVMLALLVLGNLWLRVGAPAEVEPLFKSRLPWWSYLLFAQNFFMPGIDDFGPKFIAVTWSLAVEEQFYLFLPFIIYFVPRRSLSRLMLALFLLAPILRATAGPGIATYVLLPFRLDSLMAGALVALAWNDARWREWTAAHRAWLAGAWFLLAIPSPFLLKSGAGLSALNQGRWDWLVNTWLAVWFALTLVLIVSRQSWLNTVFRLRPLQWSGRVAYGLYLLHLPMLWLAHVNILGREPVLYDARTASVTAFAMVLSLLAAGATYRWIEAPFLALGKRFSY